MKWVSADAATWFDDHSLGGAIVWQAVLILVSLRTVAKTFVLNDEPNNCLDGKNLCDGDVACRILLQTMAKVCDDTIYECHTSQWVHCHSVLTALQSNTYFHRCTCDQRRHDTKKCLDTQNFIFLHACVTHDVLKPRPDGGNHSRHTTRRPELEVFPEHEDIEEEYMSEASCIRVRKDCRLDLSCNSVLTDFRNHCRENKKAGTCVATDRRKCFEAMEDIQSSPLDLMDCTCHMKRKATLERCHRIQSTIANNTCLVSVPYHLHTARDRDTRYSDLVRMVSELENPAGYDRESTCIQAFMDCNYDNACRTRMSSFMTSCIPEDGAACDKQTCLDDIQKFFTLVRPDLTRALMFCRCREGDKKCDLVSYSLLPSCALTEEPPPTCTDVIERCTRDPYCRVRLHSYEHNCAYDKNHNTGCTVGYALCRDAQVGIMGTILTTNCTCANLDEAGRRRCEEDRRRLQQNNMCKEMALGDFHTGVKTAQQNQQVWADSIIASERQDCQRHLGDKIPSFMNIPSVVRRYHNDSDCSDLCQCLKNGTLVCRRLLCSPNIPCRDKTDVHAHGSSFRHGGRGQCRCIKGEVICAKSPAKMNIKQGLYLHVGYSVSEKYLIEGNSDIDFEPQQISHKLGSLMNGDSAEQFCQLLLYHNYDGNLVYEIIIPSSSPKQYRHGGCIEPAKMISSMINSRNPTILADAILSVLKVAQLERISFHKPTPSPLDGVISIGGSCKNTTDSITLLLLTICTHKVILLWGSRS